MTVQHLDNQLSLSIWKTLYLIRSSFLDTLIMVFAENDKWTLHFCFKLSISYKSWYAIFFQTFAWIMYSFLSLLSFQNQNILRIIFNSSIYIIKPYNHVISSALKYDSFANNNSRYIYCKINGMNKILTIKYIKIKIYIFN